MTSKILVLLSAFFIGFLSNIFSTFVMAKSQTMHDKIAYTAEQFVIASISPPENAEFFVKASPPDSRLQFDECLEPLHSSVQGNQSFTGNVTVLISCLSSGWQVYVPVKTQLLLPRVVAVKPLSRGKVLAADDIAVQMVELRFQRGIAFESPNEITGSKMKRNVRMGDVIQSNDICLVCRNDKVNIIAGNQHFSIITEGIAMSDGSLGEQVKVQNVRSKKILSARVTAVGEVSID